MWQKLPLAATLNDIAYHAEKITKSVHPLRCILAHENQVREKGFPFAIRDVAWIRLPLHGQPVT